MKTLSLIDGAWMERSRPEPTPEERAALDSPATTAAARRAVTAAVVGRSRKPASPEDEAAAVSLYNGHFPVGATPIGADIFLPAGTGIINCRVRGEHRQIRF